MTTSGSTVEGEDSKAAAIREAKEELGIEPKPHNMNKIKRLQRKDNFTDIWILQQNVSSADIDLSKEEVSEVKSVHRSEFIDMIESGDFYDYGKEYFEYIFEFLR